MSNDGLFGYPSGDTEIPEVVIKLLNMYWRRGVPRDKKKWRLRMRQAKYVPELNEIEPVWRGLKAHHLAHQTFTDIAALDQAIHDAVIDLNRERIPDPL
jgi:hypothetical protein